MTRIAVYPGSFDPPTKGHEDLVRRSLALADRLIVAVAVNAAEAAALLGRGAAGHASRRRSATTPGSRSSPSTDCWPSSPSGSGASVIVRGLRAVSDFEYEFQMALMNRQLHPSLETVFLVPAVDLTYLSSSLVREVARFGGDVSALVHPAVAKALARRFRR